ncbi:HalOD1 output domain-containing protein [Halomicroarcula sp. GCM10025324]|uniref:HalOD1 output domain-containing protein n=1 Tax=Haloarcula TaxID=2237 RepID=UPI0023E86FB7|nr:HalOD1 output domain-containing protein [Halomicroarcula sp. ZS-22-S1]
MESIAASGDASYSNDHDWTTVDGLVQVLIEAMAEFTGTEWTDLPPLYDYIDPEALEHLFSPTKTSTRVDGGVFFHYNGYPVVVHSNGRIEIYD